MAGKAKTEASLLERVCLYYEVMSGARDWHRAWRLANGKPLDEVIDQSSMYYHWFRTPRIKREVELLDAEKERNDRLLKESAKLDFQRAMEVDAMHAMESGGIATDFRNREQFLNWLNGQVNTISDEKLRVDYLKMMSDLMRFKEADNKDKVQDIQRFYTPLLCRDCELYRKQEKEMQGKAERRSMGLKD